jgi:transcriptional regulator with XRE-family HTH domain
MPTITKKIDDILKTKNLSRKELSKLINCTDGALNQMIRKDIPFSENVKEKILPILEVSEEEFESWILADKYPKEVLKLAIQAKKDFPDKRKSIFTTKIDSILQQKGMSRTALSKEIKYSQGSLNKMIIGKRGLSKSVLERISEALDISQNDILSWIVADRYSLQVLEPACAFN